MYFIHCIVACAVFTFLGTLFCPIKSNKKRLISIVIIPIFFFSFFYNYNFGLLNNIFPVLVSWLGAFYTCIAFLFFSSFQQTPVNLENDKISILKIALFFVLEYIGLIIAFAVPWAIDTFPLSNVEAVLFTLYAKKEGAENFVLSNFKAVVLYKSILAFIFFITLQFLFAFIFYSKKLSGFFSVVFLKVKISHTHLWGYLLKFQKIITVMLFCYAGIMLLVLPFVIGSDPFTALFQKPVNSELYLKHYVDPDSAIIKENDIKKNLIVIFLESMETNFSQYTKEIVNWEKKGFSFAPGGEDVSGTSWTIAAITAKLCGIPLNMPMGIDEYLGDLPTYLPEARCITDILAANKYKQYYLQGSSGDFTQKRKFWNIHGNVEVHDIEFYKEKKIIPKDYNVFWGFEDRKLYDYAKKEISAIDKSNSFAFYMLTVDTHQPSGYLDGSCLAEFPVSNNNSFPSVLRCASKQLDSFLKWAEGQPWYSNTVIAVMGDHSMKELSPKVGIPSDESLYWTNFILNSSVTTENIKRQFSSLDIAPTLLEAMGFKLKNHSFALGRSLFSREKTMLEMYGREKLDVLLRQRSFQYNVFLYGYPKEKD